MSEFTASPIIDQSLYRALFDAAGDSMIVCSKQGLAIECNQSATDLFGCTREELIGTSPVDWSPALQPNGRPSADMAGEVFGRVRAGEVVRYEWEYRRADGLALPVEVSVRLVQTDNCDFFIVVSREITARRMREAVLRQQMRFSDAIISSLPGVFYMVNTLGQFIRVNSRFLEVTGYSKEELDHMIALDFFEGQDKNLIAQRMQQVFELGDSWAEADLVAKSGIKTPYYFTGRRTCIDEQHYLIGLGTDISERRLLEQEMVRQARTDSLTGLANRRHFMELAKLELARALRHKKQLSVLMVDLDDFKLVNDCHGHHIGDSLLRAVADTIRKTLREIDIAGRLGGEEFGILLPESDTRQSAEVAERLRQEVAHTVVALAGEQILSVTASIGISTLSDENATIDKMLSLADKAMYDAKHAGRNQVCLAQAREID
jgi:diguanylate cyclase (GGDEF)-like protein/PAS domain S-box-containing protein